jgi:uncharacterized membrane protein
MYFKRFIDDVDEIKAKDTNKVISDTTKGALVGAGIGGAIGLIIGFARQKKPLFSCFIGAVVGAGVSKAVKFKK